MNKFRHPIFMILGLSGSFILGEYFLEQPLFIFMIISMCVNGFISTMVLPGYGFAILITFILAIAFYNVGISWILEWDVERQGISIGIQTLLSFAAFMAWICGYSVRVNHSELVSLRRQLEQLRKVEEHTGVLTFNEFVAQAQILFTGMKRRDEEGFLIKINFNKEQVDYKARIESERISRAVLASIREKYDIAGHLNSKSIILYLNNTTMQGVEVVLQRLKNSIQKEAISASLLDFNIEQVRDTWSETVALIHTLKEDE